MKKSMINAVHIEGILYSHSLEAKVSGENSKNPGTPYIAGTIDVATDNEQTNIVSVHFTYVTPAYSSGKSNPNYNILADIIAGKVKNATEHGADIAAKLRIDSAIGLNEFYSDRNGTEELVSVKRNEGGFIHIVNKIDDDEKKRSTFSTDMVITGVTHVDADDERNLPEKVKVKGCIFDFRNALLPVEFSATSQGAMNYFEGLGVSNKEPVFTKVWGREESTTITRTITEESAFDEPMVREVSSTRRDFVITGALTEPYDWDDESTITAAELTKAMTDRQTYLASIKQRQDEYKASQGQKATDVTKGKFDF
jgi:hypothetical protein